MGQNQTGAAADWVPQACTLPIPELQLRTAEFDRLFAAAVRGIERTGRTRLRLDLEASPQVAGRTAELMSAETACCSFFTFTLTATAGRLVLEITVPARHAGVLDALGGRAAAAAAADSGT
jgi:hypothetical protein